MSHTVFVYGTLKRGFGNHTRLMTHSRFTGHALTIEPYRMLDGPFPVLLDPDPLAPEFNAPVAGEVHEVDATTLAALDRLEDVGKTYDRRVITVTRDQSRLDAFIYVGTTLWTADGQGGRGLIRPNSDGLLVWPAG